MKLKATIRQECGGSLQVSRVQSMADLGEHKLRSEHDPFKSAPTSMYV